MPRNWRRGFTLVEAMLATALFTTILVFILGSYEDMLRKARRDRLVIRVNQTGREIAALIKGDLQSAGYHVGFPADAVLPAPVEAIANGIRVRRVRGVGFLSAGAAVGATILNVTDTAPFAGAVQGWLVYSKEGTSGISQITEVRAATRQIVINPGLIISLAQGAWVAVVETLEYTIVNRTLLCRVNGGAASTVATGVEAGSGFVIRDNNGTIVSQITHNAEGTVDFNLVLVRQSGDGPRAIRARTTVSERVRILPGVSSS